MISKLVDTHFLYTVARRHLELKVFETEMTGKEAGYMVGLTA